MKIIRNIGTVLVVSLLIMATGGFSIYHHFCHCAGEISASVFMEALCDHENSSASCCSSPETHSCCMEKPVRDSKPACHDDDNCCQTSSQFLKISDSFQPGFEKISLKPFVVTSAILFFDILADENALPHLNLIHADLPPPDSGRQIILELHQLKLDPSLV
jgi:hypothetical protein